MINDFPEPDPKLLEPIPISNVKSPYGRADLVKFFEIVLQSHSELMTAQDEFNRAEKIRHILQNFLKLQKSWLMSGKKLPEDFWMLISAILKLKQWSTGGSKSIYWQVMFWNI